MADVVVCGRCGARCWATATACFNCGQTLTSARQPEPMAPAAPTAQSAPIAPPAPTAPPAAGWYGSPPSGYATAANAAYSSVGTGIARPIGIILLALVEAGIAAVGIFVAVGLFYGTVSDFSYGDFAYSCLDVVDGLAFLVASGAGVALIAGIWAMRPSAWLAANVLSAVLIGLIVASMVVWGLIGLIAAGDLSWGLNLLDIVGIVVNLSVLASLNANPMRRHFGRPVLF